MGENVCCPSCGTGIRIPVVTLIAPMQDERPIPPVCPVQSSPTVEPPFIPMHSVPPRPTSVAIGVFKGLFGFFILLPLGIGIGVLILILLIGGLGVLLERLPWLLPSVLGGVASVIVLCFWLRSRATRRPRS